MGVRLCLVDGAWGFASSTVWVLDEVVRLACESAAQAPANARSRRRKIDIGLTSDLGGVTAKTPIERDPFDVPLREKVEVAGAFISMPLQDRARNAAVGAGMVTVWERKETTFASTDGAFFSQTSTGPLPPTRWA